MLNTNSFRNKSAERNSMVKRKENKKKLIVLLEKKETGIMNMVLKKKGKKDFIC